MKSGSTCSEEAGLAGSIPADHDVLSRAERPHHRPLPVRLEALYNNGLDVHFRLSERASLFWHIAIQSNVLFTGFYEKYVHFVGDEKNMYFNKKHNVNSHLKF